MGHRNGVDSIKSIIESVSDPIFVLDSDGIITAWNDAACELFGYSTPEAVGSSIIGMLNLHDTNRQQIYSLLGEPESRISNESAESVHINAMGATGDLIHVKLERIESRPAVFLVNRLDQPVRTATKSEHFDVSEYRSAIEHSTDLIAAIDQNERLLIANERYRTFHQLDEPVFGKHLTEILPSETYAELKPHLDRVLDGETAQFEMERTGPDGGNHFLDVRYYPLETQRGQIRGVVTATREFTGLKHQAQSLRNAWETYRELIQAIPHQLVLYDTNGDIIEVNEAACHLFELGERELLSKNIHELVATDRSARLFKRLERNDSTEEFFETEYQSASGKTIPVDVAATRVDHFGTEAILAVSRDISAHKAYKRELERINAGLEEFATVVSQDLRNPLTVAKGWATIAQERDSTEPLQQVIESLERMDHVIDYSLTLSRKGEGLDQLSRIELEDLVENCWNTVETGRATLKNNVDLSVRGDRGRVSYLFEMLFENCTDVEGSGKTIRVGNLTGPDGFFIAFEGADLPAAIDTSESTHIGSESATDWGLEIVRRIANAHGWRMRLDNDDSTGFRLTFSGIEVPENQ